MRFMLCFNRNVLNVIFPFTMHLDDSVTTTVKQYMTVIYLIGLTWIWAWTCHFIWWRLVGFTCQSCPLRHPGGRFPWFHIIICLLKWKKKIIQNFNIKQTWTYSILIANILCQHIQIDIVDTSFGYLSVWKITCLVKQVYK